MENNQQSIFAQLVNAKLPVGTHYIEGHKVVVTQDDNGNAEKYLANEKHVKNQSRTDNLDMLIEQMKEKGWVIEGFMFDYGDKTYAGRFCLDASNVKLPQSLEMIRPLIRVWITLNDYAIDGMTIIGATDALYLGNENFIVLNTDSLGVSFEDKGVMKGLIEPMLKQIYDSSMAKRILNEV